jgi:hypothetical protein
MLARYNLRGQEASDSSDAFFFVGKSFLVSHPNDVICGILDVDELPFLRTLDCLVCVQRSFWVTLRAAQSLLDEKTYL